MQTHGRLTQSRVFTDRGARGSFVQPTPDRDAYMTGQQQVSTTSLRPATIRTWSWIAFCLALPGASQVEKYLGALAAIGYFVAVLLLVVFIGRVALPLFAKHIRGRRLFILETAVLCALISLFVAVYPIADARKRIPAGADRDDALNIAVTELVNGRYPYYPRTYLDAPISPLPGALLFAAPFVLLGSSAYQNVFWMLGFYITSVLYLRSRASALLLLCTVFAFCPTVLRDYVVGSDVFANSIYVLALALLMLHAVLRESARPWHGILAAVVFGVALSSRINFALLAAMVVSVIVQKRGWKTASGFAAVGAAAFVAVTVPFYLYDPGGFSPLHTLAMTAGFGDAIPLGEYVVPGTMLLLAILLPLQRMIGADHVFLRNCAIIQAWPVVCGIAASLLENDATNGASFGYAAYGLNFLFFGLLGAWAQLAPQCESSTVAPQPEPRV